MNFALRELREIEERGLRRSLVLRDKQALDYSSNDYLNLSKNPQVKRSALKAIEQYGTGTGGSRLMAGNLPVHENLERELAALTAMKTALVFGSGFLANIGVLGAVAERNDTIFADRLNHASLVDGAINSRARFIRYRHCNMEHLEELIMKDESSGKKIIVTDSLFSMDGDIPPLRELRNIASKHDCILIVDEAHAIGVFGNGGGLCKEVGITPDILTGTLSKSLGSYGGFAASTESVREFLVNRARSFIYTTGLPPSAAGAALGALSVLKKNPNLGRDLLARAELFKSSLEKIGVFQSSPSQIVPVITGRSDKAVRMARTLEENGILAVAVRPPTVPDNTARLRFSVTLAHSPGDLVTTASRIGRL